MLDQPEPDQCEILPLALVRGLILWRQAACLSPGRGSRHLPLRNPEPSPASHELSGIQRDGHTLFSLLEHVERLIRPPLCLFHPTQAHKPCGEWAYFTNQVGKLQATCQRLQGRGQGIPLSTYLPQTKIGGSLFRQPASTALGTRLKHLLIGSSSLSKLPLSCQEFGLVTADGQDEGVIVVDMRHLQCLAERMASLLNLPAQQVHRAEIHVQNTAREQIAVCQVFKGTKGKSDRPWAISTIPCLDRLQGRHMPEHFSLERGLRAGLHRSQDRLEIGRNALILPREQQGPGSHHTQARPTVCDLVRQRLHPVPDCGHLSVGPHCLDALLNEIGCLLKELAGKSVPNGLVHQAMLLVPGNSALM